MRRSHTVPVMDGKHTGGQSVAIGTVDVGPVLDEQIQTLLLSVMSGTHAGG